MSAIPTENMLPEQRFSPAQAHPGVGIISSQEDLMPRRAGLQRGYLKKVGPSWVGQWKERVRDRNTGKVRWATQSAVVSPVKKLGPTGRLVAVKESEARAILHETILSRLPMRSTLPAALGTVQEFWTNKFEPGLIVTRARRKTMEDWRTFAKYVLPVIGPKQVRHVTPEDVERIILPVLGRGYGRTAQKLHSRLGTFFRAAKQARWYSGDLPTEGTPAPRYVTPERAHLTAEQLAMLIGGDDERRIAGLKSPAREMVAFIAMTGLRIGEVMGLRWRRVNLTDKPSLCDGDRMPAHSLFVREAFVRVYGKALGDVERGQYQELKTDNGRREIPLPLDAVTLLGNVLAASKWTKPDSPVFAGQRSGKPVNAANVLRKLVRPVLGKLGLPLVDWHGLRHSEATLVDEAGMPGGQMRRMLGHGSEKIGERYRHANIEAARPYMEAAARTFADALKKPVVSGKVVEIKKVG